MISSQENTLICLKEEFLDEDKENYVTTIETRNAKRAYFKNGKLYQKRVLLSNQILLYVMDKHNHLYVESKDKGIFHHSYFLAGKSVKAAGIIETNYEGEIEMISNESGHYRPKTNEMISALKYILDKIQFNENIECVEYEGHDYAFEQGIIYIFNLEDVLYFNPEIPIHDHDDKLIGKKIVGSKINQICSKNLNDGYDNEMTSLGDYNFFSSRYGRLKKPALEKSNSFTLMSNPDIDQVSSFGF